MDYLRKLEKALRRFGLSDGAEKVYSLSKVAVPLEGLDSFPNYNGDESDLKPSSPGYSAPSYEIEEAKRIMARSEDRWVVVPLRNASGGIEGAKRVIQSPSFKDWLERKGYGEDYKILVVATDAKKGDYREAGWILHDVFGHAIEKGFGISHRFGSFIRNLHFMLPSDLRMSGELLDMIPDILVGILSKSLSEDDVKTAIELTEEDLKNSGSQTISTESMEKVWENLKGRVQTWKDSLKSNEMVVGSAKVYPISLW